MNTNLLQDTAAKIETISREYRSEAERRNAERKQEAARLDAARQEAERLQGEIKQTGKELKAVRRARRLGNVKRFTRAALVAVAIGLLIYLPFSVGLVVILTALTGR